jgi:hypothetical protein
MEDGIQLDGRKFHGITQGLSAAQSDFIQGYLISSGMEEVLYDADLKKRTNEERTREGLTRLYKSGMKQLLLAGCLTEVGKKWTRAEALRNAERFDEITDQEEKNRLQSLIVTMVIAFFGRGAKSPTTSQKSSSPSEMVPPTENEVRSSSASSAA